VDKVLRRLEMRKRSLHFFGDLFLVLEIPLFLINADELACVTRGQVSHIGLGLNVRKDRKCWTVTAQAKKKVAHFIMALHFFCPG
jgi:hypothetical protein